MTSTTTFDIRQEAESKEATMTLSNYAFANSPRTITPEDEERYLSSRGGDKVYFSYVDDEPLAKVAVIPMTLNVRGSVVPMGGISGVASMPLARRGGHIRALMQHAIEGMHADGQAVSTLYPFKTSYYEMFGYAGWQIPMWARIDPAALSAYLSLPRHGTVKQRPGTDGQEDFYDLLTATQQRVHGMAKHPKTRHEGGVKEHLTWLATVHEDDAVTAGINYKLDLDKGNMDVYAAFWNTLNGKLNVFDFMARHVDQVKRIRMPLMPGEQPHLWLSDDDQVQILSNEDHAWNAPMARIVTVSGLNGIPVGEGSVTLTIRDEQAQWNDGIWTFTGRDGSLDVTQGGESEGDITINGLSALLFSGIVPHMLPHRGWGEVHLDVVDTLQALFPPITPHLHEMF